MSASARLRMVLLILSTFLALTAIPGGLALIAGIGAPPPTLLAGTPFSSFVIPGLVLVLIVGGSAIVSAVLTWRRNRYASFATLVTGLVIMAFEFVEILSIGAPTGPALVMQILYFALGAALVAASAVVHFVAMRRDPA